jgi:hypothetical protein
MKKQDKKGEKVEKETLPEKKASPVFRQILIETDGTQVVLRKSEVSKIELVAIMNMVISHTERSGKELTKTN